MTTISITINANTKEEYQQAVQILSEGLGNGEVLEKVDTSTVEKQEKKIKPEVAKKTRYFLHVDTNKTFVIEKGSGLPVEAIELGAAKELTKKEYEAFKQDKKEGITEEVETKEEEPSQSEATAKKADVQAAMKWAINEKGARDKVKEAFATYGAERISDLEEKDYANFIATLKELVGE